MTSPRQFAFTDDAEKVRDRLVAWGPGLRAEGPQQAWLAEQVVAASVRIDGCRALEDAWRYRQASRAGGAWDLDRVAEVERLAEGLGRRPARVAARLRQTVHGCDWLSAHWRVLAALLRDGAGGGPSRPLAEEHRRLACDLLGLSAERRLVATPLDLPPGEGDADLAAHQGRLIDGELAGLERLKLEGLVQSDAIDQASAQLGIGPGVDATIRLIRRYEASARRERREAMDELRRLQSDCPHGEPRRVEAEARFDDESSFAFREAVSRLVPEEAEPDPPAPAEAPGGAMPGPAMIDVAAAPVEESRPVGQSLPVSVESPLPPRTLALPELYPAARPLNRRGRRAEARKAARRS